MCPDGLQGFVDKVGRCYGFETVALEVFDVSGEEIVALLSFGDCSQKTVLKFGTFFLNGRRNIFTVWGDRMQNFKCDERRA